MQLLLLEGAELEGDISKPEIVYTHNLYFSHIAHYYLSQYRKAKVQIIVLNHATLNHLIETTPSINIYTLRIYIFGIKKLTFKKLDILILIQSSLNCSPSNLHF